MTRTDQYKYFADTNNNMRFVAMPYKADDARDLSYFVIGLHNGNGKLRRW